ncbi:uncharacterized protein LOC143295716 [Babylonia areolata]|uniref:uncharacterized protein LOC143295716 n=1 Tax=Babylonia areolata TaxID=304850 RepID=UPI003FD03E02
MQTNMADEGLMEEAGNQHLNTNTVVVTASGMAVEETVNEDILQEAFGGSEGFDQEHVEYAVQADTDDVSQSVVPQIHTVSDSGLDSAALDSATQIVAQSNGFGTETYRVVNTLPDGTITLRDELIVQAVARGGTEQLDETESGVTLADHNGHHVIESQQVLENQQVLEGQPVLEGQHQILEDQSQILVEGQHQVLENQQVLVQPQQESQENIETVDQEQHDEGEKVPEQQQPSVRFTLVDGGNHSGAPLGSSLNPIRIIQQGNSYTPMQQLTNDQLQQIMQVVQQQQLARNTQESGGSVLFNPSTNTRIVYRVIYPSELHKGQPTVVQITPKGTTASAAVPVREAAQLPKRPYRRRGKDDEEDKMDGPEMSKEEKEERKKHRPRTRSGRVSKPPKHMVKDYKHIHVLDWDEDYDDSDGGYSDYKGSGDEEGNRGAKEKDKESTTPDLYSGLAMSSSRPKNHKCQTCEKSYIGQAGLARHYRLNPSHGSLPADAAEDGEVPSNGLTNAADSDTSPALMNNGSTTITTLPNSVGGLSVSVVTSMGSNTGNLSEDSNTQDSIPSSSGAISPITTTRTPRRGRGGYRGRGRWMYRHHNVPTRKKQKLKEVVKTVDDDDLMEVVLPRLVRFVNLWEFMLMKLETCNGTHPRVDHIFHEYLALHKRVRQVCQEGLQPKQDTGQQNGIDTDDSQEKACPTLKLEDEAIAKSLGLTCGTYDVRDMPVNEYTSFRYKYLTSDPNGPPGVAAEKRTIQVVSPDELVSQSPAKRSKTTSLLHSSSTSTPSTVVSLASSATAASSLLTSIVSNSGLTAPGHKQPALFRTVSVQQPQSSLLQTVRVQQPQSSLLQNVTVQQPQSVVPTITLPPQQQPSTTTILRTVSVPSQPQPPTVLRTVAMPSQQPVAQTSLLRVQQPVVVPPASKPSSSAGVMGVSLLNNSRSAVLSQHPSIAVLKSSPGQSSHILVAAPASPSVTGPSVSEIPPQSQAAQVVSVLPPSMHTTSLSLLPQTPGAIGTDFTAMAPDDFMDNSDDSLVSSVSALSSANSSGLVSAQSSLPNGDMTEVGFSSVVKVNGVFNKSDSLSLDKDQITLGNDGTFITSVPSLQDDPEQQLPVSSAMEPTSTTTSLLIKCENGELYTIASTGETVPLTSASADSVLASAGVMPAATTPSVNGLLNGSQLEDTPMKEEKDGLAEDQAVMLADESVVMNQEDPLQVGTDAADMELDESVETSSFTFHHNAALYQTEDGAIIIQNPDGTSFQLQGVGEQGLTLESVQELLSQIQMASGDQVHTEVQQ